MQNDNNKPLKKLTPQDNSSVETEVRENNEIRKDDIDLTTLMDASVLAANEIKDEIAETVDEKVASPVTLEAKPSVEVPVKKLEKSVKMEKPVNPEVTPENIQSFVQVDTYELTDKIPENSHGLSKSQIEGMTFADILAVLLKDTDITDVNYNGRDVFIQHNRKGRYKFSSDVSNVTIENFVKDVVNPLNGYFNVEHPIVDCEIQDLYSPKKNAVLRLNAVHTSISPYGNTLAVRITQPELRLREDDETFAARKIFKLIEAMVRGNLNILISGRTGSGKTELQKFLVNYIRDVETIVLIEDTKDTNLKDLYPKKNISSWVTNQKLEANPIDFDVLIRASLRNNPDWIIVSETRGSEAYSMIKSGLSGHKIITTLHSDSAASNVDRLVHMCREKYELDQVLLGKMITDVFDVGIHIDYEITNEGTKRYICEIVEYRDYGEHGVVVNPIYSLNLRPVKAADGSYGYERVGEIGKISKELFQKLAKKRVLSSDIDEFIEEDYYGERKER